MDPSNISRLDSEPTDGNRETDHRRNSSERVEYRDEPCIPPDFDDNEDVGFVDGRKERLAEAMYDC